MSLLFKFFSEEPSHHFWEIEIESKFIRFLPDIFKLYVGNAYQFYVYTNIRTCSLDFISRTGMNLPRLFPFEHSSTAVNLHNY